jgi:hypothetical protein
MYLSKFSNASSDIRIYAISSEVLRAALLEQFYAAKRTNNDAKVANIIIVRLTFRNHVRY